MVADYLTAERSLGRIAAEAEVDLLAPTLIGAAHLLFADRTGDAPPADADLGEDRPGAVRVVVRMVADKVTGYAARPE